MAGAGGFNNEPWFILAIELYDILSDSCSFLFCVHFDLRKEN